MHTRISSVSHTNKMNRSSPNSLRNPPPPGQIWPPAPRRGRVPIFYGETSLHAEERLSQKGQAFFAFSVIESFHCRAVHSPLCGFSRHGSILFPPCGLATGMRKSAFSHETLCTHPLTRQANSAMDIQITPANMIVCTALIQVTYSVNATHQ